MLFKGWKEISDYVGTTEKQAQRLEKSQGLPVLRPEKRSSRKPSVFATKSALDAWLEGPLERVVLKDTRVIALDKSDKILWGYDLPATLRPFTDDELRWRVRVDLHSKGERGVLVTARFLDPGPPDTMYYLSSTGELKWKFEADAPLLDRDGKPFDKAWAFRQVLVTPGPSEPTIWAALANEAGWAGCLLRIDSEGNASVQLANTGYVEQVCYAPSTAGECLIACGENNAFDQAFVALIGIDDPPCTSPLPGRYPRYRYGNAPGGSPRKYILLPQTELIAAKQKPYGHAWRMRQYPDDIIVEVETGEVGGFFLYHFSPNLEPRYIFPSGSHEFMHRDLERTGRIDHPWEACHEMDAPLVLNIWEPAMGWRNGAIRWRDNPWREK